MCLFHKTFQSEAISRYFPERQAIVNTEDDTEQSASTNMLYWNVINCDVGNIAFFPSKAYGMSFVLVIAVSTDLVGRSIWRLTGIVIYSGIIRIYYCLAYSVFRSFIMQKKKELPLMFFVALCPRSQAMWICTGQSLSFD